MDVTHPVASQPRIYQAESGLHKHCWCRGRTQNKLWGFRNRGWCLADTSQAQRACTPCSRESRTRYRRCKTLIRPCCSHTLSGQGLFQSRQASHCLSSVSRVFSIGEALSYRCLLGRWSRRGTRAQRWGRCRGQSCAQGGAQLLGRIAAENVHVWKR